MAVSSFSQTTYYTDSYGGAIYSNEGGSSTTKYYIIKPSLQGVFSIEFSLYHEEYYPGDHIYIYKGENETGQLIGSYDFYDLEYSIKVSGQSSICIKFETNGSSYWYADYWTSSLQSSNYIYTALNGSFDDGSSTNNYLDNIWNKYVIKPANALKVGLNFTKFNTEAGFDFVSIYDGENDNAKLIGTYDNSNPPPTSITSSGGALCLIFESDGNINYDGWAVNYAALNTIEFYYDASGNRYLRKVITFKSNSFKSARIESQTKLTKTKPAREKFEDNRGGQKITIYPNPTQGQIKVEITGADLTQKTVYYIYNTSGKLIMQKAAIAGSDNIDLSNYANGIYILRIIIGDNLSEWKIVKE
jgi:hypothetical protein